MQILPSVPGLILPCSAQRSGFKCLSTCGSKWHRRPDRRDNALPLHIHIVNTIQIITRVQIPPKDAQASNTASAAIPLKRSRGKRPCVETQGRLARATIHGVVVQERADALETHSSVR